MSCDCSRLGVCHASTPTSIINNSSSENGLCQLCPEGAAGREGDRGGVSEDRRPGMCLWEQVMRAPPSDCISSKLSRRPEIVSQQRGDCWLLVLCDFSANF